MAKASTAIIELRFPWGGLDRSVGFDQQPPYCTPYCQNVRPFDVVNLSSEHLHGMRQRGGARPGLTKAYAAQLQDGPIQMLAIGSTVSSLSVGSNILLAVADGYLYQNASGSMVVVTGGPHFNATATQLQATQVSDKVYIADYRATCLSGINGTIANTNRLSESGNLTNAVLSTIDTATDVVYIANDVDVEANIFPITSVTTGTPGYITFTGTMTNQVGNVTWQVGRIPKVFDPDSPTSALTVLGGTLPIPRTNYNVGTVTVSSGAVTMAGGDWTNIPEPTADNMLTLTLPNASGIGEQQYLVATVNQVAGTATLIDTTSDADMPSGTTYTLSWTSDFYGLPPLGCPLCCTYRGRLVFAGPGSLWYMSRVLDPDDWDYGYDPNDPARPIAGTSSTTGGVGEPIVALIPHSDQYLIFGCESSLWLLTGDPSYGGVINAISRDVGVLGPTAWCSLADGSVLVLSRDGVYQIPAGGQGRPVPISRKQLPAELLNVDWQTNTVALAYDVYARAVHISVTPTDGSTGTHYYMDMTLGRFWPVVIPDDMQPTAMLRYAPNATSASDVIFGSHDGYLRKYSTAATTDDGTAIASFVVYGPFRPGGPGYVGEVIQVAADLDTSSQDVTWKVYTAATSQQAVEAAVDGDTPVWTGTWEGGSNHRRFMKAVGNACIIVVSGTYGWAIEGLRVETRRKGPIR